MSEVQNFKNHNKFVPAFHFFVAPILMVNIVWSIEKLVHAFSEGTVVSLLVAIALLVLAFSVGLATTLTAVGLAFLYARNRIRSPTSLGRWPQFLPVLSALAITLVGALLCYGAVTGSPL